MSPGCTVGLFLSKFDRVPGKPGKSQKEGQEDQEDWGKVNEQGGGPLALLHSSSHGPPDLPSGSYLAPWTPSFGSSLGSLELVIGINFEGDEYVLTHTNSHIFLRAFGPSVTDASRCSMQLDLEK